MVISNTYPIINLTHRWNNNAKYFYDFVAVKFYAYVYIVKCNILYNTIRVMYTVTILDELVEDYVIGVILYYICQITHRQTIATFCTKYTIHIRWRHFNFLESCFGLQWSILFDMHVIIYHRNAFLHTQYNYCKTIYNRCI